MVSFSSSELIVPLHEDYIVQAARFEIISGFGCIPAANLDGVDLILLHSWVIILPLISVVFYFRESIIYMGNISIDQILAKVVIYFVRHRKTLDDSLQTNGTITPDVYFRALAVGITDASLFLLAGIIDTVFVALQIRSFYDGTSLKLPFYIGWEKDHTNWAPPHVSYSLVAESGGARALGVFYVNEWTPVVVGFCVFAMFGTTQEARQMYSRPFRFVAIALGWEPRAAIRRRPHLSTVKFTPHSNPSCSTDGEQRFVIPDEIQRPRLLKRDLFSFAYLSHSGGVVVQCPGDDSDKSRGSLKVETEPMYAHGPFSLQCTS
jgi:hypothetical protein